MCICLSPDYIARNLGVVFDSALFISHHISVVSESCLLHIRDLRCICLISQLPKSIDYCNSLFLNLPSYQLNRLQLKLKSAVRTSTKTAMFHHNILFLLFPSLSIVSKSFYVFLSKSSLSLAKLFKISLVGKP